MTRHDHVARFDIANAVRPVTKETDTRHEPTHCLPAAAVQRPAQSARDSQPAVRREERQTYMTMGKEEYVNVAYQIAVSCMQVCEPCAPETEQNFSEFELDTGAGLDDELGKKAAVGMASLVDDWNFE